MVKRLVIVAFVLLNTQNNVKAQQSLIQESESVGRSHINKEVTTKGNPWALPEYGLSPPELPLMPARKPERYVTQELLNSLNNLQLPLMPERKPEGKPERYITQELLNSLNKLPEEKKQTSPYWAPQYRERMMDRGLGNRGNYNPGRHGPGSYPYGGGYRSPNYDDRLMYNPYGNGLSPYMY